MAESVNNPNIEQVYKIIEANRVCKILDYSQ